MQFLFFLILKGSSTSSLKKYTRLKIYERTHLIKKNKKRKKIQSHCFVIHVSPHHWLLHSDKGRWGKLVDAHRNREGFLLWLCTGLNKVWPRHYFTTFTQREAQSEVKNLTSTQSLLKTSEIQMKTSAALGMNVYQDGQLTSFSHAVSFCRFGDQDPSAFPL